MHVLANIQAQGGGGNMTTLTYSQSKHDVVAPANL
jgi:hypothetical protein